MSWRFAWIWLLLAPIACGGGGGGGGGGDTAAAMTGGSTTGSSTTGGSTTGNSTTGGSTTGSSTTGSSTTGNSTGGGGTGSTGGSGGSTTTGGGTGTTGGSAGGGSTTSWSYPLHWTPSASSDVMGYELGVWTDVTAAGGSPNPPLSPPDWGPINIPQPWTSDGSGGLTRLITDQLFPGFQPQAGRTYYLRLRAVSNAGVPSDYSNRIAVVISGATLSGATSGSSGSTSISGSTGSTGSSGSGSSGGSGMMLGMTGGSSGSGGSGSPAGSSQSNGASSMISVDLDGTSEFLASSAPQLIGAVDAYTVSVWLKSAAVDATRRGLFALRGSAQAPGSLEVAAEGADLEFALYDDGGTAVFTARYAGALLQDEWQNLVVAYDSQVDAGPAVFIDGMLVSASSTSGSMAGLADGARLVFLGKGAVDATESWQGRIGHAAVWSEALGDAEIAEIYPRGETLDLAQATGAYHGQDALLHYWKPGADPSAVGHDFGPAAQPIDLDDPSGGVDASDIAPDGPTLLP